MEIIFGELTATQKTQSSDILQKIAALEDAIRVARQEVDTLASEKQKKISLCENTIKDLKAELSKLRQVEFK